MGQRKIWNGEVVKAYGAFATVLADGKYFYMYVLEGPRFREGDEFEFYDTKPGGYVEAGGRTMILKGKHKPCRDTLGEHQGEDG